MEDNVPLPLSCSLTKGFSVDGGGPLGSGRECAGSWLMVELRGARGDAGRDAKCYAIAVVPWVVAWWCCLVEGGGPMRVGGLLPLAAIGKTAAIEAGWVQLVSRRAGEGGDARGEVREV